ncbi:MAG: branched-chain amino acid ABC transporter substrate-binding protein [Thermoflexales bacterium]|nr:branched-chain amino acid ABC transporter substrate-binding protein [Thermoflexales bacterium]MDW8291496.1 branched-chain amino acid ABC transporter substrate-binding protein [Anaerolineae bacterium]
MRPLPHLPTRLVAFSAACVLLAACAVPTAAPQPPAPAEPTQPAPQQPTAAPAQPAAAPTPEPGKVVIPPGGKIRIGGSFALTGPIPDPGKDIRQGAEIAIDDANAAGGVNGFLFELVAEDGACSGDQGTVVGNKFAADPTIVAVTGGTCSGETFGLKPILQRARIPFVSPSATNPAITSADCDVCNRVALSDALQGEVDAEFVYKELGLRKVAVMHDSSDYGKGVAEIFRDAFIKLGGEVTAFEGAKVGDTDFRAILTRIATAEPELLFFGGYSTEAALITQQMKEIAGLQNTKFLGTDGAYTQQYLDTAGSAAEGAFMSYVAGDTQADKLAAFREKYIAKFGIEPEKLGPFHAQSYDSVLLIVEAIKKVAQLDAAGNLVIDREALIKAIRETKDLAGITGTLTCNPIGECGAGGVQVFTVENGQFKQVYGFGLKR